MVFEKPNLANQVVKKTGMYFDVQTVSKPIEKPGVGAMVSVDKPVFFEIAAARMAGLAEARCSINPQLNFISSI